MEPSDHDKSDHDKLAYFQPGEMVCLVKHGSAPLNGDQIQKLIDWSNDQPVTRKLKLTVRRRPGEVLRFPGTYQEPDVKQQAALSEGRYQSPQVEAHSPFTLVPANVTYEDDAAKYVKSSTLVELILGLDESPDRPSLGSGASLEVVSPNWLSSPGSEWGGGGGPGGRPKPFKGSSPPDEMLYEFHLSPEIEALCSPNNTERGEGVIVAILDTAPCLHDLAAAYEKWQKADPVKEGDPPKHPGNPPKPHGLIETLLSPNGPLHVHPASYEELLRMRSVHLKDHNYNMTDHGLFVAGIIHSIAPAAEIHLYEVLNPDGVGDLTSIALGLLNVFESFAGRPLVINCSLVLNIPLENQPITDLDSDLMDRIAPHWRDSRPDHLDPDLLDSIDRNWLARQSWAIEWICDLVYSNRSRVIAAAGNDKKTGRPQPQARCPAAFESVVGVGALRKSKDPTSPKHADYSNLSDRPKETGITTFGGEVGKEEEEEEEGKEKGVLGIYLGKFPSKQNNEPGPENKSDWAWWAGTSFATPIISGVTAAVLSRNPGWATEQAIKELCDAQTIVTSPQREDVWPVTQGPPPLSTLF